MEYRENRVCILDKNPWRKEEGTVPVRSLQVRIERIGYRVVGLLVRAEYLPYGVSGLDGLLRGEPFEHEADGFAKQRCHGLVIGPAPVPIGVSKVPEASGFFRGVAELGVVTVLGATFHEVNPVARGGLKLVDARQAPAQLA